MAAIDNSADVIDSREVNERIDQLETDRDEYTEAGNNPAWEVEREDEAAELATLLKLASDGSDYTSEWDDGATLIRDSYFKTYAQELAEDCDMVPRDLKWPCNCIDWDQAARELQYDYGSIEFQGVTYWLR